MQFVIENFETSKAVPPVPGAYQVVLTEYDMRAGSLTDMLALAAANPWVRNWLRYGCDFETRRSLAMLRDLYEIDGELDFHEYMGPAMMIPSQASCARSVSTLVWVVDLDSIADLMAIYDALDYPVEICDSPYGEIPHMIYVRQHVRQHVLPDEM
jgi:hypothetical protein